MSFSLFLGIRSIISRSLYISLSRCWCRRYICVLRHLETVRTCGLSYSRTSHVFYFQEGSTSDALHVSNNCCSFYRQRNFSLSLRLQLWSLRWSPGSCKLRLCHSVLSNCCDDVSHLVGEIQVLLLYGTERISSSGPKRSGTRQSKETPLLGGVLRHLFLQVHYSEDC